MTTIRRSRERGFVSLLTSIMISLLLLVIVMSMVVLETLQLRKSEDAEQSLRAYYAAEAGVEDAVSKVLSKTVTADQACTANTTYDIPGAAGWTCQQISFSGTPEAKLDTPDQAKTVDPGPGVSFNEIELEWDQTTNAAGYYNDPFPSLPSQGGYSASPFAAPLELSVIEYPKTPFRTSDICTSGTNTPAGCSVSLQNALLVPGGSGGLTTMNFSSAGFGTSSPYHVQCTPARADYRCAVRINGFIGSRAYLLRVRSRYAASAFRMTFRQGGSVVPVPDGTATIDVTAKAGQSYRRTISKLPLNNSAAAGLNYVLYSDSDTCKDFQVVNNIFPAAGPC